MSLLCWQGFFGCSRARFTKLWVKTSLCIKPEFLLKLCVNSFIDPFLIRSLIFSIIFLRIWYDQYKMKTPLHCSQWSLSSFLSYIGLFDESFWFFKLYSLPKCNSEPVNNVFFVIVYDWLRSFVNASTIKIGWFLLEGLVHPSRSEVDVEWRVVGE